MISIAVSFLMILLFLISGKIVEGIKRLLMLIVDILLKLLNLFGIRINTRERHIKTSRLFKQTFKDIKIVKQSKENNKMKPSINLFALIMFLFSLIAIVVNLQAVSGNIISATLFNSGIFSRFITTQHSMDVTVTAILFSIVSFSLSKLISQWRETAPFRKTKKEMKLKRKAISLMSSKDLLDAAKELDKMNYDRASALSEVQDDRNIE